MKTTEYARPPARSGSRRHHNPGRARETRRARATREPGAGIRQGSAGAPIDPRIRARRAEVLRGQARRRLRVALGALIVLAVLVGCWALLHSRAFSARVVTVVGAVHTPASEIIAAAGLADHPPLIDVTSAATARLERLPWVAQATVTREWPDGVRIHVVERSPVAAVSDGGRWMLVARSGKVLARVAAPPAAVVHVSSPAAPGLPGTTMPSARPALQVAASLPVAFKSQVASVDAGPRGTVTLHLTSGLTVDLGSTAELERKYEDIAAILAGAKLTSGDVIDVAAPAAPIVTH